MSRPLSSIENSIQPYSPPVSPVEVDNTLPLQRKVQIRNREKRALETIPVAPYSLPCAPEITKPTNVQRKSQARIEQLLLDVNKRCYDLHKENTLLDRDEIKSSVTTIDGLHKRFLEELKKQGLEQQSNDTWKGIQHVAQYITAFASLAFGAFLLSQGQAESAAQLMIFAAGLGIFSHVMKDVNGFETIGAYFSKNKETQKTIASTLEMSFVLLSLGIGLYQIVATLPQGYTVLSGIAENKRLEFVQKAIASSGLASKILSQGMQQYHTSKIHFHGAAAKKHGAIKTYVENTMSRTITTVEANIRNQDAYVEVIKRMLNNIPVITNR